MTHHPDHSSPTQRQGIEVHRPTPLTPVPTASPPIAPQQAGFPAVQSVQLPDGRIVTGYALTATPQEPERSARPVSRTAVNVALGGVGFAAVCGGLVLLTGFIAALAAFVHQLVILAAVVFGGWVAAQVLGSGNGRDRATVHIRKAVIKRNHFHG